MPNISCRIGEIIHFVFPIVSRLSCVIQGCPDSFPTKKWKKTKSKVLEHLEAAHNIKKPFTRYWCSICKERVSHRLALHHCFKDIPFCSRKRLPAAPLSSSGSPPGTSGAINSVRTELVKPPPLIPGCSRDSHSPPSSQRQSSANDATSSSRPKPGLLGSLISTQEETNVEDVLVPDSQDAPIVHAQAFSHGSPPRTQSPLCFITPDVRTVSAEVHAIATPLNATSVIRSPTDATSDLLSIDHSALSPGLLLLNEYDDCDDDGDSNEPSTRVRFLRTEPSRESDAEDIPPITENVTVTSAEVSSVINDIIGNIVSDPIPVLPTVESTDRHSEHIAESSQLNLPSSQSISSTPVYPEICCRDVHGVHLVFPLVSHLKCTEAGCNATFVQRTWTGERHALLRHLRTMHSLPHLAIFDWCAACHQPLTGRLSLHDCLRGQPLLVPGRTSFKFKCQRCDFSCATASGIKNHARTHRRDDALNRQLAAVQNATSALSNSRSSITPGRQRSPTGSPASSGRAADLSPGLLSSPEDSQPFSSRQVILDAGDHIDVPTDAASQHNLATDLSNVGNPDAPSPSLEFIQRFREILESNSDTSWQAFEDTLIEYIRFVQDHLHLTPPPANAGYRPPNHRHPAVIQRIYKRNRRRAMRLITSSDGKRCNLDPATVAEHFCPSASVPVERALYEHPCPATEVVDTLPCPPLEAWARLRAAENSAAGIDLIAYQHWREMDPEARALSLIFSICLKHQLVPSAWKLTKTILIPKGEGGILPSDWRPIALGDTIAKLFASVLAKRLSNWAEEHNLLSPSQKGFRPFDGAFEICFAVEQAIQDARANREDICMFSLDLSNAFGSVPHEAIRYALLEAGAGASFVNIIEALYTGCSTTFVTDAGTSDPIDIAAGVRQGCPLSGILFNFAIDPVLRAIDDGAPTPSDFAFADDLHLKTGSPSSLQEKINKAANACTLLGFSPNAAKSFSLHISGSPVACVPTTFYLNGEPVKALRDSDPGAFLGKRIGLNLLPDTKSMDEFKRLGTEVLSSSLAPWQRIDALKTFYYPALHYAQRTGQFSKSAWDSLDKHLRPLIKKTLGLPSNASNEYLYGDSEKGLCGIPLCAEDSDIALIDGAMKLLTSPDPRVSDLAWKSLTDTVAFRIGHEPSVSEISEYLSGAQFNLSNNRISNAFTKARSASTRLKVDWHIHTDRSVSISFEDVFCTDRKKVFKFLRKAFRNRRFTKLSTKPHQGKTCINTSLSRSSVAFFRQGKFIRFTDWRFIHKARLGLVPLNGCNHNASPSEALCRVCHREPETLPHVINHCNPHLHLITQRHNAVVNRIKEAASRKWNLYSENRPIGGFTIRPDLILTKGDEALILDITCPFENGPNAFSHARLEKERKYQCIADHLRHRFKKVSVEAIVVGSLGAWDSANDKIIARLCSRKYANLMRQLIVTDTIRFSRDIYTEHITGQRQNTHFRPNRNYVSSIATGLADLRSQVNTNRQMRTASAEIAAAAASAEIAAAAANVD